jgi:hypothetical protein
MPLEVTTMHHSAVEAAIKPLMRSAKQRSGYLVIALLLSLVLLPGCGPDGLDSADSQAHHFHTVNNDSNTREDVTGIQLEIMAMPDETTISFDAAKQVPEHVVELIFHAPKSGISVFNQQASTARNIQFIPDLDSLINMQINHNCKQKNSTGSRCQMSFRTDYEEIKKLKQGRFSGWVVADQAEPALINIRYLISRGNY